MSKPANLLFAFWMLLLAPISALAAPPARVAISPQRVAEALTAAGVPATSAQVKFLFPVTSTFENSDLEVVKVSTWTGGTAKVELRCHDSRACLPFYVLLSHAGTADLRAAHSTSTGQDSRPRAPIAIPATQAVVRNGDSATLVFEDTALRITMPVICLESGSRGQKIRVVSADHKRYFKAEVLQAGLLKATL